MQRRLSMLRERSKEMTMLRFSVVALAFFASTWRLVADVCPGVIG